VRDVRHLKVTCFDDQVRASAYRFIAEPRGLHSRVSTTAGSLQRWIADEAPTVEDGAWVRRKSTKQKRPSDPICTKLGQVLLSPLPSPIGTPE
jgi:hypothetical protein